MNINDIMNLIDNLSSTDKDVIYRHLWEEYLHEDVIGFMKEMELEVSIDKRERIANEVVYRYIYEGDYDCNLSYWDSLENLINEVK